MAAVPIISWKDTVLVSSSMLPLKSVLKKTVMERTGREEKSARKNDARESDKDRQGLYMSTLQMNIGWICFITICASTAAVSLLPADHLHGKTKPFRQIKAYSISHKWHIEQETAAFSYTVAPFISISGVP